MATNNDPTCYIWLEGADVKVQSPYDAAFVQLARSYSGFWDRAERVWRIPRRVLINVAPFAELCRRHYAVVKQEKPSASTPATPSAPQSAGHIGAVGGAIETTATITRAMDLREGRFGPARLYVMHTAEGHMLVWRSTSMIDTSAMQVGERVYLRGTIKQHDLYRGAAQTVLTRCKVLERTYPSTPAPAAPQNVPEHVVPEESGEIEASNTASTLVEECGF